MEIPKKRILSETEIKKLLKFGFQPKAEKVIKEIWEETAEEKKDYSEISNVMRLILALIVWNLFLAAGSSEIIETARGALYLTALILAVLAFYVSLHATLFYSFVLIYEEYKKTVVVKKQEIRKINQE